MGSLLYLILGIDINNKVVQHAQESTNVWLGHKAIKQDIKYFTGSVFDLDIASSSKYDRIYIGAACTEEQSQQLMQLLALDGILVAPVEDMLLRIQRSTLTEFKSTLITSVRFVDLIGRSPASYANLPPPPVSNRVVIPPGVWSHERGLYFPPMFRRSVRSLLLCHLSRDNKHPYLPRDTLLYIVSYMNR